ncbi:Alpha/Beta hydrolase protein [Xylaria sp. CBS 124048]|nr:Alpha/Beta hydrolase protein [Xylaria sp. CBS 124048]
MVSTDPISYLKEPLNPYITQYDSELRENSEIETSQRYNDEQNGIGKRPDWRFQRTRRNNGIPSDEDVWSKYELHRDARSVPRDTSRRSGDYQKLVDENVITPDINIVVAHQETIRAAKPGSVPCIFYIHGGCRYGGTPYSGGYLERAQEWGAQFNAIVISVDYRLSPNESDESPTGEEPTNDCFDALTWVYHHLGSNEDDVLKYGDRAKIIVFGTSAGGGLAAATVLKWYQERQKDAGRTLGDLHGLLLEAPQLDDRCDTESHREFNEGNMLTSGDLVQGWTVSLGDRRGSQDVSIFEAPARASDADVREFPPTYIEVGTADPLRDEARHFHNLLLKANVEVEIELWEGGYHGFFAAVPGAAISARCRMRKLEWLRKRLM